MGWRWEVEAYTDLGSGYRYFQQYTGESLIMATYAEPVGEAA